MEGNSMFLQSFTPMRSDRDSAGGAETSARPSETGREGTSGTWVVEMFHDGECPLCRREVSLLRRLDRRGRIKFTDIAAPDFDPGPLGIDRQTLNREIHARLPDGTWITGVEVFRRVYAAVGFRCLVTLSRLPVLSQALDLGYRVFARNRLRLTGRCSSAGAAGTCDVKPTASAREKGQKRHP